MAVRRAVRTEALRASRDSQALVRSGEPWFTLFESTWWVAVLEYQLTTN